MSKKANYIKLIAQDAEIDLRNDTITPETVLQGFIGHNAKGEQFVGTAQAGGSVGDYADAMEGSLDEITPNSFPNITSIRTSGLRDLQFSGDSDGVAEISEDITSLGDYCFNGSNVREVILSSTLTYLGYACFENCYELTTVTLPYLSQQQHQSPYSLSATFNYCNNLRTINFLGTLAEWSSFNQGTGFGFVTLRQMITIHCTDGDAYVNAPIGNMVLTFMDDTTFVIPVQPEIQTLNEYQNEYGINVGMVKRVEIPNGVTSIPRSFATDCGNLREVIIPDTVNYIGDEAFNRTSLSNIIIPSPVSEIGSMAFYGLQSNSFTITCRSSQPFVLGWDALNVSAGGETSATLAAIYVLSPSVNNYKQDTNWSQYASIISADPNEPQVTITSVELHDMTDDTYEPMTYTADYGGTWKVTNNFIVDHQYEYKITFSDSTVVYGACEVQRGGNVGFPGSADDYYYVDMGENSIYIINDFTGRIELNIIPIYAYYSNWKDYMTAFTMVFYIS